MQLLVSTKLINSSQSNWAISQGKVKNATSLKPPPRHMYVCMYVHICIYIYIISLHWHYYSSIQPPGDIREPFFPSENIFWSTRNSPGMEPLKAVNGLPLGHVENHTCISDATVTTWNDLPVVATCISYSWPKAPPVFLASNKFSISLDLQYQTV